jgi:hypothetical protein
MVRRGSLNEMTNRVSQPALAAAERRRKRARLQAVGVAVATFGGVTAFYAALGGGVGVSIWFPGAVGFYTYARRVKGVGVVVWLRRFRPGYGKRFRFHQSLAEACHGLAAPVTIQDRSFRFSYGRAMARLLPFIMGIGLLIGVFIVAVIVTIALLIGFSVIAEILGLILGIASVAWAVPKLLRRSGLAVFVGPAGASKAKRRLAHIARTPRCPGVGVEILKCSDDIWRAVVTEALHTCKAVVIDVTDVTSHIEWEIAQALAVVGESRIVLVAEEGTSMESVIPAFASTVGQSAAADWVRERLVTYPRTRLAYRQRKTTGRDVMLRLREAIARALGAPPASSDIAAPVLARGSERD